MNKTNQHIILDDGRKLGFAEYGNLDGYPILYCHGSQSSRLEMHYDMSFAIDNGLRIVTIDRPGHGLSNHNPTGTILGFANDAKQLTEHLGIEMFSVVGMSAGSPFALGIAYSFPKNVRKASIISGFAPYTISSKKHLSREVRIMLRLAKSFPFLLRMLLKVQAKQLAKKPRKILNGFLKSMCEPDQEILKDEAVMRIVENMFKEAYRNGSEGVAYELSNLLVKDWGFKLNEIQIPITFWQGDKDNNVPHAWASLMKNEVPHGTLNRFPDEGHLIIFQHAEEIFSDLKDEAYISSV